MKKIVTTYLPSVRSVQWNTLRSSITRPSMQKIKARYFTLQTEQARSIIGLLYGSWTESVSIFFSHELNWLSSVSRGNNIHAVGMHVQSWRMFISDLVFLTVFLTFDFKENAYLTIRLYCLFFDHIKRRHFNLLRLLGNRISTRRLHVPLHLYSTCLLIRNCLYVIILFHWQSTIEKIEKQKCFLFAKFPAR